MALAQQVKNKEQMINKSSALFYLSAFCTIFGIGVATGIFEMFMFIAFFLFYLFNLIVEGSSTQTKTVEEDEPVETKAEAVEETKEEDAKVEE